MQFWIVTALQELEVAAKEAQERLERVQAAALAAQELYNHCLGVRNATHHLLRDFREYAAAQEKGGAQ